MTDQALALVAAFQACGGEAEALPDSDEETLELGRRLTSGKECYPLILTTGDLAKLLRRPDFDPERSAFFMPAANGPCRFGQYHRFHRLVLDELGYPQVPVYSPDQSENMYQEVGMVGEDYARIVWNGMVAIDLLEKKLRETRPYERYAGESDKVYEHYLQKTYEASRDRQDLPAVLREARRAFEDLSLNPNGRKPIVGIVGEIYTRANQFSNENAVREIEALGGEVWMPPIGEWLLYVTHSSRHDAWTARHYLALLKFCLEDRVQKKDRAPAGRDLPRQHQEPEGALHRRNPGDGQGLPAPLLRRRGHPEHGQIPGLRAQGGRGAGEHHALYLHAGHRGQLPVQALPGAPRQHPLPQPGL